MPEPEVPLPEVSVDEEPDEGVLVVSELPVSDSDVPVPEPPVVEPPDDEVSAPGVP